MRYIYTEKIGDEKTFHRNICYHICGLLASNFRHIFEQLYTKWIADIILRLNSDSSYIYFAHINSGFSVEGKWSFKNGTISTTPTNYRRNRDLRIIDDQDRMSVYGKSYAYDEKWKAVFRRGREICL